jgi:hypothetical protein
MAKGKYGGALTWPAGESGSGLPSRPRTFAFRHLNSEILFWDSVNHDLS